MRAKAIETNGPASTAYFVVESSWLKCGRLERLPSSNTGEYSTMTAIEKIVDVLRKVLCL